MERGSCNSSSDNDKGNSGSKVVVIIVVIVVVVAAAAAAAAAKCNEKILNTNSHWRFYIMASLGSIWCCKI